jgi:hypothetical protein
LDAGFMVKRFVNRYSLSRKCARAFAANMCSRDRKTWTNVFDAAAPATYGNYGNHFIIFVTVLALALVMTLQFIYVTRGFLWIGSANFTTPQGIRIVSIDHYGQIPLPRERWILVSWGGPGRWCADFSYNFLISQVRESLLTAFAPVTIDQDMLFLYLRGGRDIWNFTAPNRNYAQPPCSFYFDSMRNFTKMRVIGDKFHPCTDPLIRAGADWELYNDTLDMSRMVFSRHIALGRSSRSHAVLALSPFPKQFWVFDQRTEWTLEPLWWRGYSPLQFGYGLNCVPSEHFRRGVFPWRASSVQIQLILHSKCNWEPTPCTPNVECSHANLMSSDEPV